ncbi:hypothetical protein [Chitinivibrio alkaliphilus]|uniref:Uncharacterized protein n=1 Tax=Chitinivibrio alkaliphilus ACht1 TaxID=1313304 RepID=U7DDD4_9BACT|nr:hypothetical protein [Chitinivibrio alkaliphilus]ERP38896.1 hypothetical protein CALK_0674 [Chitinivibrio alkaliphilus ACht1]
MNNIDLQGSFSNTDQAARIQHRDDTVHMTQQEHTGDVVKELYDQRSKRPNELEQKEKAEVDRKYREAQERKKKKERDSQNKHRKKENRDERDRSASSGKFIDYSV